MVDTVALRSLPYRDPDRILAIDTRKSDQPEVEPWTSDLDFLDFRERARTFSSMAAISPVWNVVMTGQGSAERLECLYVSAEFFPMLGVKPALGRVFTAQEDRRGAPTSVVVISHSLWARRFGAGANVLGQRLTLDGGGYTVIGVLPAGFRYAGRPLAGRDDGDRAWFPLSSNQLAGSNRGLRFLKVIGRLAPGATLAGARDETQRIGEGLAGAVSGIRPGILDPGRTLADAGDGAAANADAAAAGCGWFCSSDHLRQRVEPAVGAHGGPRARNLGKSRAGRKSIAADAAIADGGHRAGGRRRLPGAVGLRVMAYGSLLPWRRAA